MYAYQLSLVKYVTKKCNHKKANIDKNPELGEKCKVIFSEFEVYGGAVPS